MSHEKIKASFSEAVAQVVSNISQYATNPGKDFTRVKKFGPDTLLSFMVSCECSTGFRRALASERSRPSCLMNTGYRSVMSKCPNCSQTWGTASKRTRKCCRLASRALTMMSSLGSSTIWQNGTLRQMIL